MKSPVTLVAVYTHTHTNILSDIIANNSKTFYMFKNRRNLNYNCIPLTVIL